MFAAHAFDGRLGAEVAQRPVHAGALFCLRARARCAAASVESVSDRLGTTAGVVGAGVEQFPDAHGLVGRKPQREGQAIHPPLDHPVAPVGALSRLGVCRWHRSSEEKDEREKAYQAHRRRGWGTNTASNGRSRPGDVTEVWANDDKASKTGGIFGVNRLCL